MISVFNVRITSIYYYFTNIQLIIKTCLFIQFMQLLLNLLPLFLNDLTLILN